VRACVCVCVCERERERYVSGRAKYFQEFLTQFIYKPVPVSARSKA